jgi:hypothetical protein
VVVLLHLSCVPSHARQLVTNFLPWRPGFSSRLVYVGFIAGVTLGQVFD